MRIMPLLSGTFSEKLMVVLDRDDPSALGPRRTRTSRERNRVCGLGSTFAGVAFDRRRAPRVS